MTSIPEFALAPHEDEEGLFSRNIEGQLVRLDAPTQREYHKRATISVDGRFIKVPIAEPLTDAQGNNIVDRKGRTVPRHLTVLDAVWALNEQRQGHEQKVSIPTLCHQPHMTPVAVCRLCMVQVCRKIDNKMTPERKLQPACQLHVKDGMAIFTMDGPAPYGDRVRKAVRIMTELLIADHLKPSPDPANMPDSINELKQKADLFQLSHSRFAHGMLAAGPNPLPIAGPPTSHRPRDPSSPVFLVDHSACILCDRCIRSCNEVKKNNVIGRTGKGPTTGIAFDLDVPMSDSSCVQCGECMVSCPTSAITFKSVIAATPRPGGTVEAIPLDELKDDPLFAGIPFKFLLWQKDLVVRRRLKAHDPLCLQDQPGNSAFIIKEGELEVWQRGKDGVMVPLMTRTVKHVIVGEMACLSGSPRSATVLAKTDGEVWEVRRNVLDRMMRSPKKRKQFRRLYRKRALTDVLRASELFKNMPPLEYEQCISFLQPRLTFVRAEPDEIILQRNTLADCLYLIRLGHVRVEKRSLGEDTFFYCGPGTVIGEMGLLSISDDDVGKPVDDVWKAFLGNTRNFVAGPRNATCIALDHVELARVAGDVFFDMARQFPSFLRNVVQMALDRAAEHASPHMPGFIEQGLYQGQSLLALDLTKCTRCDECTRACQRQHGEVSHGQKITRLLREGRRFGDFLIATACRSCKDAYCMIGCPVDAIHRGKHLQIVIEDHCIGCRLCEQNCPYGNIFMQKNLRAVMPAGGSGSARQVAQLKAATCDLCDAEGRLDHPEPSCVYACPHDAAYRMTGKELLNLVKKNYGKS